MEPLSGPSTVAHGSILASQAGSILNSPLDIYESYFLKSVFCCINEMILGPAPTLHGESIWIRGLELSAPQIPSPQGWEWGWRLNQLPIGQ